MNKLIIADPSEYIGCHVCEIACVVAHNHQRWPQSTREFVPRIRVFNDAKNSIAVTDVIAITLLVLPVARWMDALRFVSATVQLDQTRCIGCILNVLQDASTYPAEDTNSKPLSRSCRAS